MKQVLAYLFALLEVGNCVQLSFGDCPVLYEAACDPTFVKFYFMSNTTQPRHLDVYKPALPVAANLGKPLKILIHGYGGLSLDKIVANITASYYSVGYNVIIVDWGALAAIPCYATAYLNTWHVGKCVALLAVSLIPLGITPDFLHLIGFSLGAHIAGFAGTHLNDVIGRRLGRITGLDPALPFFATLNKAWKLDKADASFVDIVHTSAGSFGKIEAMGHVDFYVNGGVLQPFCKNAPYPPICSHVLSGLYFAESIIDRKKFIGVHCDNLVNYLLGFCMGRARSAMGEFVNPNIRGSYFVETSDSSPFALGFL